MAKCATQSKRRAIFQVRVNRKERKVVSEGKIVLSGRQRRMVAEQLDSLHTVADCGRHCQSHFSLGLDAHRARTSSYVHVLYYGRAAVRVCCAVPASIY